VSVSDLILADLLAQPAPKRAAYYRQRAAEFREAAETTKDSRLRGDLLELARQNDVLAANVWSPDAVKPKHGSLDAWCVATRGRRLIFFAAKIGTLSYASFSGPSDLTPRVPPRSGGPGR
jgi:hypothetical protein